MLKATERILLRAGYHVVTGGTAKEAVDLTRRHLPAMLLLDVVLPDGNGVEIAQGLKSDPSLASVFVLLLSGLKTSGEDQAAGLGTGLADGYIVRPFSTPDFLARVDALLRLRAVQAALRDAQERLRTVFDTVAAPIFVKDNDHRVILANQAFYDLFAMNEEAVIGRSLAEDVPTDERQHFLAVDRMVLDTGIPDQREESLTVNGQKRTIFTRKTRFVDNSGKMFLVGSIQDITERAQSQAVDAFLAPGRQQPKCRALLYRFGALFGRPTENGARLYAIEGETKVLKALDRLKRDPKAFDLVITDQAMPGMTGLEFAARIRELRADLPVILISGYSPDLTPERIRAAGVLEVLAKPCSQKDLGEAIRRHLREK